MSSATLINLSGPVGAHQEEERRRAEASGQLREYLSSLLPPRLAEAHLMVNELQCKDPCCPPIETVFSLLVKPEPIMWKIFKARHGLRQTVWQLLTARHSSRNA